MKFKIIIILIFNLLLCSFQYSQDITNELGTGGVFRIKDVSNTFLSLSQSDGYLSLNRSLVLPQTTSSTIGIIFKGAVRFLHNYGTYNTFLGYNSGNFTLSGGYNTGIGDYSLYSNTTGTGNTTVGTTSLYYNTTGSYNTALGNASLYYNTTGSENTALGLQTLNRNSTGTRNTAVGYRSASSNTTGYQNTSVGSFSLDANTTGFQNTSVGYYSLFYNTTGSNNTSLGVSSLLANTTAVNNTGVGNYVLYYNTTGNNNTGIGYESLALNQSGFQNTAVGYRSLYSNTGNYNTAIGHNAGLYVTTGANLTLLGIDANPTSGTVNNQITLGNGFVTSLRCNVTTITSLSDMRDKKNITDLSLGLDFITKLKPRQFNWDKREWYDDNNSDGSKMQEAPTAGFIAQELDQAQNTAGAEWLNLVLKDNPEKWEATPGNLLPIMVKAIQELKTENDELKNKNGILEERLAKYEQMQNTLAKKMEELEAKNNDIKEIKLGEK